MRRWRLGRAMALAFLITPVLAASSASASMPDRVAANLRGLAEMQYRMLAVVPSPDAPYPACHRVCNLLWQQARELDPSSTTTQEIYRELYVLGAANGLFEGFDDYRSPYGITLEGATQVEENVFGGTLWPAAPQRHLGVTIPGANHPINTSLVPPGTTIRWATAVDEEGNTLNNTIVAPTLGWATDGGVIAGPDMSCPGGPFLSPGDDWQALHGLIWCSRLDPSGNPELVPATMREWFSPATFDGLPSFAPGSYTTTTVHHHETADPTLEHAEDEIEEQFEDHQGWYLTLIAWMDVQLGGDGHFAPDAEQFYGGSNPAAPNLTHTCAGDPVDCATGNFYESVVDTQVAGPGVTLTQTRTYNSQLAAAATAPGAFGFGWSATFRDHLEFPLGTEDVIVHQATGSPVRFTLDDEDGRYSPDSYVEARLTAQPDGTFTFVLPTQLTMTFSAGGRLLSEVDANGNATTLGYDGGRLMTVTDPVGRHLTFTYNGDGTVATAIDPAGHTVHYAYDGGRLTEVTDVGGETMAFDYDSRRRMTTVVDQRGHTVTTNTYDNDDRVVGQTDAHDQETTWSYASGTTTITDPSGSVTQETFEDHLPVRVTQALGTASEATTTFTYDRQFNRASVTDANDRTWKTKYDINGNPIEQTDPLDHTTRYQYDGRHHVTKIAPPAGRATVMEYDSHGNLQVVRQDTSGLPQQVRYRAFEYDELGLVTATHHQSWGPSRYATFSYDAHGNRVSSTGFTRRTSHATYDVNGFALTSTTPLGKTTTTTRNAYERPVTVTDPRGKVTTYEYDEALNQVGVTDREGHHDTTTFDALNRPTEQHRADGTLWETHYTSTGEVASRSDGADETTTYTYDHQHRLRSTTDPLDRVTTFSYDPAGNQTEIERPNGQVAAMTYDAANRLTDVDYDSSATPDISYTYDANGRRATMTDGTGTTSYAYDPLQRLVSQTNGAGQTTSYGYDSWDRVTSINYPDALQPVATGSGSGPVHVTTGTVQREYDNEDHLTSVTDWLGNTTAFGYDNDGELTLVVRPNGVNATYTYDDAGVVQTIADNAPTTTLGRDDERLLTSTDDGTTTASYSYDAAQRLTGALSRAYVYDDADNLTQTATAAGAAVTQQFDAANQVTSRHQGSTTTATFTYDQEGRRATTSPSSGPSSTYAWSQADELLGYDGPDATGASAGTISEGYEYDGDGLRMAKTSDGQRTHEAYDTSGGLPLMLTDGAHAYIFGPGGLPLEQVTPDGTVRYFHQDQLGSTTSLTSSSGATVQTYAYDAYGQLTSPAPIVENPFRYAGQYTDAKTGLQDLRARYYEPATGQFLSRDPAEDATLQPYAYAGNNPANATDPTGLSLLSTISDAAAGSLDGLTGGLSTQLAAALLHFDVACADFGAGFPVGQVLGTVVGSVTSGPESLLARSSTARLAAKTGRVDLDALSAAGRAQARGGRSAAGRSYQKHMDRGELPRVQGTRLDQAGQDLLDDVLTHPGSTTHPVTGGGAAGGTRIVRPDGTGVTFGPDGSLAYFGRYN